MTVTHESLRAAARLSHVLWIEPRSGIAWSGERQAMTIAGKHDSTRPNTPEPVGGRYDHHDWLIEKGFCTPTEAPLDCMVYWTKVGVVDSGLDNHVCSSYNEASGICTTWVSTDLHPNLNHASNLSSACPSSKSIDGDEDCTDDIIRPTFFCADSDNGNQCIVTGTSTYEFFDNAEGSTGHGTAVASIIAGDPLSIAQGDPNPGKQDDDYYFMGTGVAPSAQIIVARNELTADWDPDDGMTEDYYQDLVAQIEDKGARFVHNSWNIYNPYDSVYPQYYTLFSEMADKLVRDSDGDHEDDTMSEMTLVFSAGNWLGTSHTWTFSPGNAKNVISVGATRGWTDDESLPQEDCEAEDHVIGDIAGGAGDDWHSRRQYVDETERIKPDLVAPGTMIAAARSAKDTNSSYIYKCFWGTSAAAPAVTGAAILAEAWYYYGIEANFPSPAMLKALLVAHADNLVGGTDELTGNDILNSPSASQGWGRVNLDKLFQTNRGVRFYDQDHMSIPSRRFTSTGQLWSVTLQPHSTQTDIIAVLAYTDAAASAGNGELTMNDLDLRIFVSGGTPHSYWGNSFDTASEYSKDWGGPTYSKGIADSHNNVEVIRIEAGSFSGSFSVSIRASAINRRSVPGLDGTSNNQDFALYIYNTVPIN